MTLASNFENLTLTGTASINGTRNTDNNVAVHQRRRGGRGPSNLKLWYRRLSQPGPGLGITCDPKGHPPFRGYLLFIRRTTTAV
jgi:hypothetical protein